ncbi:MAG: phosphate ABC transporter permease PstA [Nitrospinae bacterium]|nr:phosphate ABC transporter permease PstA [Nitrospinota bacterium]
MAAIILIGLVVGLLVVVLANGIPQFWPSDLAKISLKDGSRMLGKIEEEEKTPERNRILVRIANRDLNGLDFKWVDSENVVKIEYPPDASVIERDEYGPMYGFIESLKDGETVVPSTQADFEDVLNAKLASVRDERQKMRKLQSKLDVDKKEVTGLEVRIRRLEDGENAGSPETLLQKADLEKRRDELLKTLGAKLSSEETEIETLGARSESPEIRVLLAGGEKASIKVKKALSFHFPNSMGVFKKSALYLQNAANFIRDWPRESNTEGGVYPAIFGTVMMVFIMVITCTPLGVMTALYMNEYARHGFLLSALRLAINNLAGVPSIVFGIFGLGFFVYMVGGNIDGIFFADKLPEPTYGTGGILWASLTLALLTVPVVIVSAIEGLSSVPRANRDGALALGASKFQMLWNVVLPNAMPGILTGIILAVSRAAGEVAPLMITGVVKLVSSTPVDSTWPYVHLDRKFMHLGFHIYDVGFQSPNVEAAKPMVYTTTALLLVIVASLNLAAIVLRNKLRKKYAGSAL